MMYYSIYFMYTINLKPSNNRTVTNYAMTLQLEKNSDSTDIFNINSKFAPLCDEQSYEYTPVRMQADSPAASSVCTSKRVMRGSWGLRCCKCAMQYVKEEEIWTRLLFGVKYSFCRLSIHLILIQTLGLIIVNMWIDPLATNLHLLALR